MSDTLIASMGQKGRVVIPQAIREHQAWSEGTTLILIETESGVEIRDRDQALSMLRRSLQGPSLSDELVAERRREALAEVEQS